MPATSAFGSNVAALEINIVNFPFPAAADSCTVDSFKHRVFASRPTTLIATLDPL